MPPSLQTSNSTYPSLTSETSSIASSELPRTASVNLNHSPSPWRAPSITTDKDKDHSERSSPPRFAKRLLRLVGPSQHHHSQSLPAPTNVVELSAYTRRQQQTEKIIENNERTTATRKKHRTREEHAASWGRTSLVSAASTTPLASKHSSLGPLPIFPRPPIHNSLPRRSRTPQSSFDQSSLLSEEERVHTDAQPQPPPPPPPEHDHQTEPPHNPPRTITPTRQKSRPTLASLFQSAGRKALRRDEFRKDSYREPEDDPIVVGPVVPPTPVSQSVPSTPLRRRFLGLMSNASDTIRSAKSTPHPVPPPPLPHISLPTTFKGKENSTPTPILRRKRSSLPIPPRHHHEQECESSVGHQHPIAMPMPMPISTPIPSRDFQDPNNNPYALRRSRSESKHGGKRSNSPGHTTSIRVPGAPLQHHPHPHPFFPCDAPLDRGLLYIPSFDFEPPVTRPSTPGQSTDFLPIDQQRRKNNNYNRGRHGLVDPHTVTTTAAAAGAGGGGGPNDVDSQMSAEIKSVLAAGTEARRERRAPSRERLRVIGPMHRQNLPDVTGGDDQLSPDPRFSTQPIPIPSSSRSKSHVAHGLFAFESPAATPYGSRIDLPPTPPPSKPRRLTPPAPVGAPPPPPTAPPMHQHQQTHQQTQHRSHHRHFSSSATAVSAPMPIPPPKDAEMGFMKGFTSPRLFAGNKPANQDRKAVSSGSSYDKRQHSRGQSLNQFMTPTPTPANTGLGMGVGMGVMTGTKQYRQDSMDSSREGVRSPPWGYRQKQHLHSHSLSGSTTVQNHYPTPVQSPTSVAGLGISLYPPTREERYLDLREAMKLSIGDSRYRAFDKAVRRYHEHVIPMHGPGGLFERVQRLLNEAVEDGLPSQTARKYLQTFQAVLVDT